MNIEHQASKIINQYSYKKDSETKTYPNETKYTPNIIDDQLPF